MGNVIHEKVEAAKRVRPVYEYDIPEKLGGDVRSIGLVELLANEELMAVKRSGGDSFKLAYELAKQSIAEVNGQKISLADGAVDSLFNNMGSQVRNLVLQAYAQIHAPAEDVSSDFLQSRKVRVA